MSESFSSVESSAGEQLQHLATVSMHAFSDLLKSSKQTNLGTDIAKLDIGKREQVKDADRVISKEVMFTTEAVFVTSSVFLLSRLLPESRFAPILVGGAAGMALPADSLTSRLTHAVSGAIAGAAFANVPGLKSSQKFRSMMRANIDHHDPLFFQRASSIEEYKRPSSPFLVFCPFNGSRLTQSTFTDPLVFPKRTDVLPTLALQHERSKYSAYRVDGLNADIFISTEYAQRLKKAALPYDKFDRASMPLKAIDDLLVMPNRSAIRQIWIHPESSGSKAAGSVPYVGADRIDFYGQKTRMTGVTQHEWAHHIDNDPKLRRAYARAAAMEPQIASISDYAELHAHKGDTTEIWAEHMRYGIFTDSVDRFLAVQSDAPLSTYVLNSAFSRELKSVPKDQRSVFHDVYAARSKHIDENALAPAQITLSRFADSAVPLERKTAQELIDALRISDPYRAEQLTGTAESVKAVSGN